SRITGASFLFNHMPTTTFHPLSLHDALPIFAAPPPVRPTPPVARRRRRPEVTRRRRHPGATRRRPPRRHTGPRPCRHPSPRLPADRKSTRLNSSHVKISYAVFCLKKKKIS